MHFYADKEKEWRAVVDPRPVIALNTPNSGRQNAPGLLPTHRPSPASRRQVRAGAQVRALTLENRDFRGRLHRPRPGLGVDFRIEDLARGVTEFKTSKMLPKSQAHEASGAEPEAGRTDAGPGPPLAVHSAASAGRQSELRADSFQVARGAGPQAPPGALDAPRLPGGRAGAPGPHGVVLATVGDSVTPRNPRWLRPRLLFPWPPCDWLGSWPASSDQAGLPEWDRAGGSRWRTLCDSQPVPGAQLRCRAGLRLNRPDTPNEAPQA